MSTQTSARSSARINPQKFDLQLLLPDFLTITEFPKIPESQDLAFLGHSNLRMILNALRTARDSLMREVANLQQETDDLDLLGSSCVQTMAESSGCIWTTTEPREPSEVLQLSPSRRVRARKQPHTCQFGTHVAQLCKPLADFCQCEDQNLQTCGQTCFTCFADKPFAGSPCIFAQNTEERIDEYIGKLIGLENHYADFLVQIEHYISRVEHVLQRNTPERPFFIRWRPRRYLHTGDIAIHAQVKRSEDGHRVRMHRAYYKNTEQGDTASEFQNINFVDVTTKKKFTSNHSNRILSMHDYEHLRKHPDFAMVWLQNYTWPTYTELDVQIHAALKEAFTKLLLK